MKHQNHFQYAEIEPQETAGRKILEALCGVAVFAFIGVLLAWRG